MNLFGLDDSTDIAGLGFIAAATVLELVYRNILFNFRSNQSNNNVKPKLSSAIGHCSLRNNYKECPVKKITS